MILVTFNNLALTLLLLNYILGRCDDPQGKKYDYQPEFLKDKLANSDEWKEFVEMCFSPGSPINNRLKEMLVQMAGER